MASHLSRRITRLLIALAVLFTSCQQNSHQVEIDSSRSEDSTETVMATADDSDAAAQHAQIEIPQHQEGQGGEPDLPSLDDIVVDPSPGNADSTTGNATSKSLAELRKERDATVWRMERLAQQHEQVIVRLWDQLLEEQRKEDNGNPFAVFAKHSFESIKVGMPGATTPIRWGASVAELDQNVKTIAANVFNKPNTGEWADFAIGFGKAGYQIEQTEWHHAKFNIDDTGTATSTISMAIYGTHPDQELRYVVSGDLIIEWQPNTNESVLPVMKSIDASNLRLYRRQGPPAFKEILTVNHATPATTSGVQPISVHDFNGDGLSEIVLGGSNELFWNRGDGVFERDTFLSYPERGFEVSLLADVTEDGVVDYLLPGLGGDLLMYEGDANGRFTAPPKGKARGGGPLRQPQAIAAGDIDNDGDIDLWIGQYKISYMGGQMPTPYFDANDGFPAYLLRNEGGGKFAPYTEEAGLSAKARRRSYGGSFVDLDNDHDLDLVVVSDFAGVDVYLNDGQSQFTDVTDKLIDQRHLFGMSLTFADYDQNGEIDFFATGMASTTARRLDQMSLGRTDRPEIHQMRSIMGYGNRMYLNHAAQSFAEPAFIDQVARTGWSWGSTSFDFDNDTYPDIFVANGHSSGTSTKDHCSHFWCHDIYDASSTPDKEVFNVFQESLKGYFERSESWDGYQKNQLLMNLSGEGFVNLGYLMGVGHEYDGRAVISEDLDGDGRLDLLVVEDQWQAGQLLHVYRNQLETDNHWVGARLVDVPGRNSPLGAKVVLTTKDGKQRIGCVTAGDSIHAQHSATVHFGLGPQEEVESLVVLLVSGKRIEIPNPRADQYHTLKVE